MIRGTWDYFAINGYTTRVVNYELKTYDGSYEDDRDTHEVSLLLMNILNW